MPGPHLHALESSATILVLHHIQKITTTLYMVEMTSKLLLRHYQTRIRDTDTRILNLWAPATRTFGDPIIFLLYRTVILATRFYTRYALQGAGFTT